MKKTKRLPATRTQNNIIDRRYMGKEPIVDGVHISNSVLGNNLNWYNHFYDQKTAHQYLIDYCQVNNHQNLKNLIKTDVKLVKTTYGWISKMLINGAIFSSDVMERFNYYLASIKGVDSPPKKIITKSKNLTLYEKYLPDVEYALDNWEEGFSMYDYIVSKKIPISYVSQLIQYYEGLRKEVKLAVIGKNDDINQAYSFMTKPKLRAYYTFIHHIINDCRIYLKNQKQLKKPRKSKGKSNKQILKHFKYMKENNDLKLTSISPERIIGASIVFTLNTGNNILSAFIAKENETLTISRTSIINYDEKKSGSKRIGRQMEKSLKMVGNANKRTKPKIMDNINTEFTKFTNRLNDKTIILSVSK